MVLRKVYINKMKITFAIALLTTESVQQCFPPYAGRQGPNKGVHSDLYLGQQEFSLSLLNAIYKFMPNQNLFFSPYSTFHALLMAYFLSGKQTESYLKKVLKLNPNQEKYDFYIAYKTNKLFTQYLSKDAPYEFKNANKLYVEKSISVRECILNIFPDELEKKNFIDNPEQARKDINNWVENITNHMITNLLSPSTIDPQTNLVLVNAAYFKGLWKNNFPPEQTKKEVFFVSDKTGILVDMMHVEGTFKHDVSETLGAHILEMPYLGGNISMYILLPPFSTENAIEAALKKLTLDNFQSITNNKNLIPKTVQVALPKFTLETTIKMTPILEFLGVANLFKEDADFSTLTRKKVSVSEGVHKARIDINENGSQAAAATAFFTWKLIRDKPKPVIFKANRPFIYYIYNRRDHTVLFAGIYKRP